MRRHILEEFNTFLNSTVRTDVTPRQKKDLQISFMCGAVSVFSRLCNMSSNELIMQDDLMKVREIQRELQDFAKQMRDGTI